MNEIGIRIFWGPWNGELDPLPVVSFGKVLGNLGPLAPALVSEERTWMITVRESQTVFACHSKERCSDSDAYLQLLVCAIIPDGLQLSNLQTPLGLLEVVRDKFGQLFTFDFKAAQPDAEMVKDAFSQLLSNYPLEKCPWYDFKMQGKEPASYCLESKEQLNALMRFHSYPALAHIEHLELGFNCKSTVKINTKGDDSNDDKKGTKKRWWRREPKPEKPKVEKPQVEKKTQVEKPKVEELQIDQTQVEIPQAEKPQIEKIQVEKPIVEEVPVEKPKVEKPEVEKVKAEKSLEETVIDVPQRKSEDAPTQIELPSKLNESSQPVTNKKYEVIINGKPTGNFMQNPDDTYTIDIPSADGFPFESLGFSLNELLRAKGHVLHSATGKTTVRLNEDDSCIICEVVLFQIWLMLSVGVSQDSDKEAKEYYLKIQKTGKLKFIIEGEEYDGSDKIELSVAKRIVKSREVVISPSQIDGYCFSIQDLTLLERYGLLSVTLKAMKTTE